MKSHSRHRLAVCALLVAASAARAETVPVPGTWATLLAGLTMPARPAWRMG